MMYLNNQISLLKKSFKLNKKRFFSVIIFDSLFVLVLYITLFLWNIWLNSFVSKVNGLDLTNLTESSVVNGLATLKSFYYGVILCLILLTLFLFFEWSFFQGKIWNIILKKKFDFDYFKKFLLLNLACIPISIILFFIAVICFWSFNSIFLFFSTSGFNTSFVMFMLLILFTFIFMPILLYLINFISILYFYFTKKNKILYSFKNTFYIAVKKIYLLYIPCLIMSLIFILLSIITIPLNFLPMWFTSLILFVLLVIYAAWIRFYIVGIITKLERTHRKI